MSLFERRLPIVVQSEASECGIACLAMVAGYFGLQTDLTSMRRRLAPSLKGLTLKHIAEIASSIGLSARGVKANIGDLTRLRLPAILHWDMNHFVVLSRAGGDVVIIHDPAIGRKKVRLADLSQHYTGVAMEFFPNPRFEARDERARIKARDLLSSTRGIRGVLAQIVGLSLAVEVLAIASSFFVQFIADHVVPTQDRDTLTVLGIGFSALAVLSGVVISLRGYLSIYLSAHFNIRMLDSLFHQLLKLPLEWFEKRHIGDILSRFQSVETIQRTLSITFIEAIIDGFMVIVTASLMFAYSPILAATVVGAASFYAICRWLLYSPQRLATGDSLTCEARAGTHFIETLRGMMAIKLNLKSFDRRSTYLNLVVAHTNANAHAQKLALAQRVCNVLIFAVGGIAVIWIGALNVLNNSMTLGMFFAFIGFQLLFLTRIGTFIDKAVDFLLLDLHAERISDIVLSPIEQLPTAGARGLPPGPLSIDIENLGFSYGVEGFVFRGVRGTIASDKVTAIVGASGSGKTTLIKTIIGLLDRTEGNIVFGGHDLREWDRATFWSAIGVVMQEDHLFVGTIEDNISFFEPNYDPDRVRECARTAMIEEEIEALPMQYHTLVGSLGSALSGGQKQRILLARALYRRPRFVFLDETFDQIDVNCESKIVETLRSRRIGVVVISHRPDTIKLADTIIALGRDRELDGASVSP